MKSLPILDLDAKLSNQMRVAEKPGALRAIAVFFAHAGDSWFWAFGLLILWLVGNSFWREWAVVQLVGISLLAALVMGIKFLVRRRRPEGEWGSIYRNTDPHSFPSGHAVAGAALAVGIVLAFFPAGERRRWEWIVAGFAFVMAFSRVYLNAHWFSDVVAGVLRGSGIAIASAVVVMEIRDITLRFQGVTAAEQIAGHPEEAEPPV